MSAIKQKTLKELQKEYAVAVKEAQEMISGYERRFEQLKKKFYSTLEKANREADSKKVSSILKSLK